jgi:hypothetical protein
VSKTTDNLLDIADSVIEKTYPDIYEKGKGWWGKQRIPNFGILRVSIANAIAAEQKK